MSPLIIALFCAIPLHAQGSRVLLDAHNSYPEHGRWTDRIERALATGLPLAIEQDLLWFTSRQGGPSWSLLSHGEPVDGAEPTLRAYFFERIRPLVERALDENKQSDWPLVTLNLDLKSNQPEHLEAVWQLLGEYESWMCTAERSADPAEVMPLALKPVLVLTGDADAQQAVFHDRVPVGGRLRAFGAVRVISEDPMAAPEMLVPTRASNYRRWWNNSWRVVEQGGQQQAASWTRQDENRLEALVRHAHAMGLWIRFYTLNGHSEAYGQQHGWNRGYNFGSKQQVTKRWRAAIRAGADYVATDQYEEFAELLRALRH